MQKILLYPAPGMLSLAKKICKANPDRIECGEISWKRFPDGNPDIFIAEGHKLMGRDVVLLLDMADSTQIFEQLNALCWFDRCSPRSFRVILPYFPTATMERANDTRQVISASTLARLMSVIAPVGPGPVTMFTYDPHSLTLTNYFGPNIACQVKTGIRLIKQRLKQEEEATGKKIAIALPDAGSYKRFGKLLTDPEFGPVFPLILCDKVRNGDKRVVTVREGQVADHDVCIVDDLIHSGGTQIECGAALAKLGANSVLAYATHGVMENKAWVRIVAANVFRKIFITDSCPISAAAVSTIPEFEVLSLQQSITNAILQGRD